MGVSALQPRLQKFGIALSGSVTQVVLIGPVTIAASGNGFSNVNIPYAREWSASVALGGSDSYFQMQISNDGTTWTTIDHLELPNAGIIKQTYGKGIPICGAGQRFRVIGIQTTASRMTSSLFGDCAVSDIVDL